MTPPPGAETALQIRRARARRLATRFMVWVVLPMAAAVVYYGCWAAPQYDSVSVVAARAREAKQGAARQSDALVLDNYIRSREMVAALVAEQGLADHYQSDLADRWSRLDGDASFDEVVAYFGGKLRSHYNSKSGTIRIRVRAFSPQMAQRLNQAIVDHAAALMRDLAGRDADERLAAAAAAADAARTRVVALDRDFSILRGQLRDLLAAPGLAHLRERVPELSRGLEAFALDPLRGEDDRLDGWIARFEQNVVDSRFAQAGYEKALEHLESERGLAARRSSYVVTVAAPSLPDAASYPRPVWGLLTVFVVALLLMGVVGLLAAAVREHAKL